MRHSRYDKKIFKDRRAKIAEQLKGGALVVAAHPEYIRNHDNHHFYRPDSNMVYLTGFEESHSLFVFRPGCQPETVLFVHPKDPLRETWEGFLFGPELAKIEYGMDACYNMTEVEQVLPTLLSEVDRVYYQMYVNAEADEIMQTALKKAQVLLGRSGLGIKPVIDTKEILGEARLFKSPIEIEWQKKACELTARGHVEVMKATRPGMNERELWATFIYHTMKGGSHREGYPAIVATGNGATTLHYRFNDQILKEGEVILVDAGAELDYYTGDITRSFPVSGKFTEPQKKIYSAVLRAQKEILNMIRPGLVFKELQTKTIQLLTESMIELGLLKGTADTLIQSKAYMKYYPHGVSHWLGLDVHDWGPYTKNGQSRPLEPGMMFTVEPGLYVPLKDESAPEEFRGIGIRIEDNILVTESGHFNMTALAPKEISDIEAIVGTGAN